MKRRTEPMNNDGWMGKKEWVKEQINEWKKESKSEEWKEGWLMKRRKEQTNQQWINEVRMKKKEIKIGITKPINEQL